ncbi:hypothetical protein [Actinoplanes sp. NPDC051411]|jgi:hypothetical protein|uniref:hypothetical protein n=1 Tax=Actinoplanes sp. NPDC051411 TaxID=3155522 RepID=UPI00341CEE30
MKTTPFWISAVSLLGASVGQLAQYLISPINPGDPAATSVTAAAAHPALMRAALVLDLPILLIVPAVIFLGLAAGYGTSRLAGVGTLLTVATVLGGGYLLAGDVVVWAAAQHPGGAAVAEAYFNSGVISGIAVFYLAGHVVGFLLLGIAAWRNQTLPRWAAVSLIAWPLLEMGGTAAGLKAVGGLGDALLVVACVAALRALAPAASGLPGIVRSPESARR